MFLFTILALAAMADGYRLLTQPSPPPVRNNIVTKMCEQNGVNNSFIEIASAQYLQCMEVNFGKEFSFTELTEAQYNNSYNNLFKKYCAMTPQLMTCYHTLLDKMSPCMGDQREVIPTTKNIIDQILDYLCTDGGYVISKFYTKDGLQCLKNNLKEITECAKNLENSILYMDVNITLSATDIPRIYEDYLMCILQRLETCKSPVPTKIFKRVLDIIRDSVSELRRELSGNVTTKEIDVKSVLVNDTQREPARPDDNTLRRLCKKNGADYEAVQAIGAQSVECMKDSFGMKLLDNDLKNALTNGSYSEILKTYCPRVPLLKTCIHTVVYGASPCFGDEAQDYIKTTMTAYDGILDYICHDDGYVIARFFAAGGLQCLKNKIHDIMTCAEESKNSFLHGQEMPLTVMQIYGMDDKLLNCILKKLKTCDNPAIFKVVESVSEIIRSSYSYQENKNITEKTTKISLKASGTVVLAFNVDVFV